MVFRKFYTIIIIYMHFHSTMTANMVQTAGTRIPISGASDFDPPHVFLEPAFSNAYTQHTEHFYNILLY